MASIQPREITRQSARYAGVWAVGMAMLLFLMALVGALIRWAFDNTSKADVEAMAGIMRWEQGHGKAFHRKGRREKHSAVCTQDSAPEHLEWFNETGLWPKAQGQRQRRFSSLSDLCYESL